jgi:hypothetical protein
MRVLLDNCTRRGIASALRGHAVVECRSQGWDRLKNGELIDAAEAAGFEIFLTADQRIRYQQNLACRKIAIVVLGSAIWEFLRPNLDRIRKAVEAAEPGSVTEVSIPEKNLG